MNEHSTLQASSSVHEGWQQARNWRL